MIYWISLSTILLIGYVLLIGYFLFGLLRIINKAKHNKSQHNNSTQNTFSILVPARNEQSNIEACLQSIVNQNYEKSLFEIIVLNDHSEDNTSEIVQAFINANQSISITLINLSHYVDVKQKKAAITKGIELANYQFIVLTDADCTRGNNWLGSINEHIAETQSKMVYAPVAFNGDKLFDKLQALEFVGLVGVGAAAIELKNPNMCSAANLIFEKAVFHEVDGYNDNKHLASGDDEFLMHKVFKKYPNQVSFLYNEEAIVQTSPNGTLKQLAQQRKRWVSKSTKYENRYITLILIMAYLFNVSIIVNVFIDWQMAVLQMILKMTIEGIFLVKMLRLYKKTNLILLLPLAELFHVFYVIIIGIWANFGTYNWKDRALK